MVKNKIVETLNNGDTVLIFPEGTTTRDGKPKQFRKGIFELCVTENIKVIPVTIKYNRDIGMDTEHPLKFSDWYDIKANVYVHDEIYDSDSEIFMKKVFDKISEPYV
jgi:1-acyl-sn-glycerol-3-phosphate acyltransferase